MKVLGVKNPQVETDYEFISVFDSLIKQPSLRHKLSYVFKLLSEAKDVDIVPFLEARNIPALLTLHADIKPEMIATLVKKINTPLIAISHSQKGRIERQGFRIYNVVYHGIEIDKYPFVKDREDYLIYVAHIDRSKGTHIAVRVAKRLGEKLVIIGPIADYTYFENYVKPFIHGEKIIYPGEVDFKTKVLYLSKAKALLYPVQYEEFFGLAIVEALACRTLVIGLAKGSLKEIIRHGLTSFLAYNEDDMYNLYKIC